MMVKWKMLDCKYVGNGPNFIRTKEFSAKRLSLCAPIELLTVIFKFWKFTIYVSVGRNS